MATIPQPAEARITPKRRYASARRVQQSAETRGAVLGAARRLFGEQGWAATGMRDVARAAGVSVETVYANFGSKSDLLLAAIDVAVVGDTEPVALADRPAFAALGRGTIAERARAGARLVREVYERTYPLDRTLREAAAGNPELAKRVRAAENRRRVDIEHGVSLIAGRALDATERDGYWALMSPEIFGLLTGGARWSSKKYETWLAQTVATLIESKGPAT